MKVGSDVPDLVVPNGWKSSSVGQLSAWSTVNCAPQMQYVSGVVASSHISGRKHCKKPLCEG